MILFLVLGLVFAWWYIFVVDLHTHDHACFGIRFWKWGRKTKEIWFIKPNYQIAKHSHPNEEIELQYVFGKGAMFNRTPQNGARSSIAHSLNLSSPDHLLAEVFMPKINNWLKKFTVHAGQVHWFSVSKWPLVFINHATWLGDIEPTSASIDYKLTT